MMPSYDSKLGIFTYMPHLCFLKTNFKKTISQHLIFILCVKIPEVLRRKSHKHHIRLINYVFKLRR